MTIQLLPTTHCAACERSFRVPPFVLGDSVLCGKCYLAYLTLRQEEEGASLPRRRSPLPRLPRVRKPTLSPATTARTVASVPLPAPLQPQPQPQAELSPPSAPAPSAVGFVVHLVTRDAAHTGWWRCASPHVVELVDADHFATAFEASGGVAALVALAHGYRAEVWSLGLAQEQGERGVPGVAVPAPIGRER